MKSCFPVSAVLFFFLSVSIPGTPCFSFGSEDAGDGNITDISVEADNVAVTATGTDNAADNIAVPAKGADNTAISAAWTDNVTESAEEMDNAVELVTETNTDTLSADNVALINPASDNTASLEEEEDYEFREPNFGGEPTPHLSVADPIEPLNRAFFVFNDKLYYWVAKPVAQGYSHVVNEDIRISVRNFFSNIGTPVRVVNTLLQGNLCATGTELLRFVMNSTIGILGFFDVARDFGIEKTNADLGQTLGKYGLGNGMYIVLPIFGASTLRDGVGFIGDSFLDPVHYIKPWETVVGVSTYRTGNNISLQLGLYEELTGAALDPYIAVKDAYIQNRLKTIRGKPVSE